HGGAFTETMRGASSGKTGQQLADEIEQARLRMLASRKAQESAQEFLLGEQKVNAAIPRRALKSSEMVAATVQPQKRPVSAAERYPLIDEEPIAQPKRDYKPQRQDNAQLSELQAEL